MRPNVNAIAGPSRYALKARAPSHTTQQQPSRTLVSLPQFLTTPRPDPRRRSASTTSTQTDWLAWLKNAAAFRVGADGGSESKAFLFAGLVSHLLCTSIFMTND
jgi:hypothetical protein